MNRSNRVAQEIQKEIALILQHKINDPRFSIMTTVSDVVVSSDLCYVKVFLSFLNDKEDLIENSIKILQRASRFICSLLIKRIKLRTAPKLVFLYDNSLIKGIKISRLLKK